MTDVLHDDRYNVNVKEIDSSIVVITENQNGMELLASSITPLGAGANFTSAFINCEKFARLVGTCFADQDGTFNVEFTNDGTNADGLQTIAYAANNPMPFEIFTKGNAARLRFVNGATPQGVFRVFMRGSYQ